MNFKNFLLAAIWSATIFGLYVYLTVELARIDQAARQAEAFSQTRLGDICIKEKGSWTKGVCIASVTVEAVK